MELLVNNNQRVTVNTPTHSIIIEVINNKTYIIKNENEIIWDYEENTNKKQKIEHSIQSQSIQLQPQQCSIVFNVDQYIIINKFIVDVKNILQENKTAIYNLIKCIQNNKYTYPLNITIYSSNYKKIDITEIFNSKKFQKQIIDYIKTNYKNGDYLYIQFHEYINKDDIVFYKIKCNKHYKLN